MSNEPKTRETYKALEMVVRNDVTMGDLERIAAWHLKEVEAIKGENKRLREALNLVDLYFKRQNHSNPDHMGDDEFETWKSTSDALKAGGGE